MIRKIYISVTIAIALLHIACSDKKIDTWSFVVQNGLDIDRSFETVEIDISSFDAEQIAKKENKAYKVLDQETRKELISQAVDTDNDGQFDKLLFQPELKPHSEKAFKIALTTHKQSPDDNLPSCYSRFVPERTDDYAWENNRVAFRTYGPTAQKMVEDNIKGGTLSSGMDAWLKRVEYPIIDKWYQKLTSGKGTYHEDTGEGLDNFHVGASRGVGGVAVKRDSTYYYSKNFISWKTLFNGPLRTSFILSYADWNADGDRITEEKHISLDYGSNLARFEIKIKGVETLSIGLTLHENDGVVKTQLEEGWASYWQPHDDSELGTGIVAPVKAVVGFETYITDKKDESNLYTDLNIKDGKIIYYAGFGWKKSGQFTKVEEWEKYLRAFALKLKNPLEVEFK